MDISKLQTLLGYNDIVKPQDALQRTAQWLVDNPLDNDAWQVKALEDPFDYAAEDKLIKAWDTAMASMPDIDFDQRPGYTIGYSGPGGRERSNKNFV